MIVRHDSPADFEQFAQKQFFAFQPVSVLEDISDQKTAENQSAIFKCRIQINYPEIFLSWYKGTQRLDNSHKYEICSVDDLHCLKVMNCNTSDEGSYRVVCGPHISNAKLEVAGMCLYFLLLCSIIFLRTGAELWSAVWSLSRSSPACFYSSVIHVRITLILADLLCLVYFLIIANT